MASTRSITPGAMMSGSTATCWMPAPTTRWPSNRTSVWAPPLVLAPGRLRRFGRLIGLLALAPAWGETPAGRALKKLPTCGTVLRTWLVVVAPVASLSWLVTPLTLLPAGDRKRFVWGRMMAVRVFLGGGATLKKKIKKYK